KVARTSTRWTPGKKAQAKVAPKTSGRLITLEEIIKHFGEPMEEAVGILRASRATLKRLCGSFGVSSWPYETDKSDSLNSIFKGSNEPHFTTNITHSPATFSQNGKHSSIPIHHQQVQTNLHLAQPETTNRNSVTLLTIKATYKKDMVRFSFKLSDGFIKLEEQIATRLKIMRIILAHEAKQNDFRHGLLFGHLQSVGLDFPIYLSKLIMWDIEGRSTDITP
ncbi:PB1 domain, RWP-RK domain, lambda repressor-like, DNA-binding domain protein, partial [Tanacetum coccineum]